MSKIEVDTIDTVTGTTEHYELVALMFPQLI
jgi:hypothetical protein